jgi:hypothetical protein
MELTERERRILSELELQFRTGAPETTESPGAVAPIRSRRQRWTGTAAAVLGILLLVAGIGLEVGSSVILGTFLVVWWLSPLLWRLLRRVGTAIRESFEGAPPSATP